MVDWTFVSLRSVVLVCAVGQVALAACSSKAKPFGDGDSDADTTGSSGDDSSGSASGSTTTNDDDGGTVSSGSGSTGGSSSGSSRSGSSGASRSGSSGSGSTTVSKDGGYVVRKCGSTPCDLRSNTCCLPADGGLDASYCVSGVNTSCGTDQATYHCLESDDCPTSGDLCCGTYDLATLTAATVCQSGSCASVQFCGSDSECQSASCIAQSCSGVSPLHLCGLQTEAPYKCTAL
jgi:hypothetical protein